MSIPPNLKSILDNIIDSSSDGIFVADHDYRYLLWSKGMERVSGKTAKEVIGKCGFDVFPFLRNSGVEQIFKKCFSGEVVKVANLPYIIPETGKSGFNDLTYSPVMGDNGSIVAVMGVAHDITERYLAEKTLTQSELKYKSLTQFAYDGFISFDEDGAVSSWNQGAKEIFGYSGSEILGKKVDLLFPPEFWRNYKKNNSHSTHARSSELFGTRNGGGRFPMDLSISAWKSDDKLNFSAIVRDISASKHVEAIAEDQKSIYEALLKAQSDLGEGMAILDPGSQKIEYVNDALCNLYGYSRDEIMKIGSPLAFIAPELKELTLRRVRARIMKVDWKSDRYETVHIRKDGSRMNVDLSISHCETGFGPSAVVLIRDISDRKKYELALREEEFRFRALAEASFEGIVFTKNAVIIEANENFCNIFGYAKLEVIGKNTDNFCLSGDRAMVREYVTSGREKPYIIKGIRKDGSLVPVEFRGKNIHYKGETVRVAVMRELSSPTDS